MNYLLAKEMNILKNILIGLIGITLIACGSDPCDHNKVVNANVRKGENRARFEPENGKVLLFVGQELNAIGGLPDYNDGYLDHYPKPAGFTMYTNLSPGDTSFGFVSKGLDGIWTTDNWGDNVSNMTLQLEHDKFSNMALAIGLSMVNHEGAVARGERDDLIVRLAEFLKGLAPRPVFLRIGYEFDGHAWNHYDRQDYLHAYRRVKDMMDSMQVNNVAYVWQSTGWVSDQYLLEEWYPGDEYVDWCGFSFFSRWAEQSMIAFARSRDKPVFICEASPTISDHMDKFSGTTKETILSNDVQAREAWVKWFTPLFNTIESNPDVVKAVSYINCNWRSHRMWQVNPTFQKIDARLQTSELIDPLWREKIAGKRYIHSSENLYSAMNQP